MLDRIIGWIKNPNLANQFRLFMLIAIAAIAIAEVVAKLTPVP